MTQATAARLRLVSLMTATVALLAACGDGGDVSATPTPPPPPPASTDVAVAYAALIGQSHSWSLSGTAGGNAYSATVTLTPGADVSYQNVLYHSTQFSSTLYAGTQLLGSNVETLWLDETTLNPVFYTESSDGSCGVVTDSTQIPSSAQIGSSGNQYDANVFTNCSLPSQAVTQVGTSTSTWSYESDSGLAFFCLNATDTLTDGTSKESDCVEVVDSAGTLGAHAFISSVDPSGNTLVLSN